MKKRLIGLLLVLCMVASLFTFGIQPAAVADSTPRDQIQGSNILHCFNWSYNEIRANLQAIKDAGYTAIQTSPVQPAKDYNKSWNDKEGQWWKLYQPLDIRIANGNETWLGSKEELTALCTEADALGLYVIVDIVANHVANVDSGGYTLNGTYNVSTQVADRLQDPNGKKNLYHTSETPAGDTNRTTMTQNHISMPDLNTGNQVVQDLVYDLLKECVDCGVDGFRFDAAKHIELPTDSGCGSDFWSDVLGRIRTYVGADNLYIYGEALYAIGTATENYTQYMAITDNVTGNNACTAVKNGNAGALADNTYYRGTSPQDYVLWAESHDTYEDDATSGVSSDKIIRTWAIVGARADSTALFLARPNERMGLASTDTSWKSPAVAAVNKFKTYYDGTGEYLSYSGNTTLLERGNAGGGAGVVIDKLDGAGWVVELPVNLMSDGVYADEVTGNVFSVSGGKITGEVGPTGVAVVYKTSTGTVPTPPATNRTLYLEVNDSWAQGNERYAAYVWNSSGNNWYSMSPVSGESNLYSVVIPTSYTSIIFCRMNGSTTENNWSNKWEQTADLTIPSDQNKYSIGTSAWGVYGTVNGGGSTIHVTADEGYYIVGTMTGFAISPEFKLTQTGTSPVEYAVDVPLIRTTFPEYNSKFKVVYSPDGVTTQDWFPGGMDNDFGHTASDIPLSGIYTVAFRPNSDGDSSWYESCIKATRTKYFVTIDDTDKNGTVTVNKDVAAAGETVTVTVTPNAGYTLDTLVYKCETGLGSGTFTETAITGSTFTMPAENAVVAATFVANGEPTPTPTPTPVVTASATPTPTPTPTPASNKLYLKPGTNWKKDGARFAMYVFNGSSNAWVSMTDPDGDGIYEAEIPAGTWPSVIFCRMNGSTTENKWDNKWNQTADLTIPTDGKNLFTVADDVWDGATTTWSTFGGGSNPTPTPTATPVPGTIGYYLVGNMNSWAVSSAYKLTQNTGATGTTEYYIEDVSLTTTSQFKIVYSADGSATTTWYPDGMGNAYGENSEITEDGTYTVYFRPNGDGGNDWFNGVIYIVKQTQATVLADGYYLVEDDDPVYENIDPANRLTLFTDLDAEGHVFNACTDYAVTGNFGENTYRIVKVENDAIVPYDNDQNAPVVTTTGVIETVYLATEKSGTSTNIYGNGEYGTGVSSLSGYYLNIGNSTVPAITEYYAFAETETAGLYLFEGILYGSDIFVCKLENGRCTARYPAGSYMNSTQVKQNLSVAQFNSGFHRLVRVWFRPDGQGTPVGTDYCGDYGKWYYGYFMYEVLNRVIINESEHGTVTADKMTADAGETVTLTITPDPGYELDTLTVVNDYNETITLTNNTFEMTIWEAKVTATFKLKPLVTLENVRYAYSLTLGDSILINERVFFPENTAYDLSKFAVAVDFGGTVQTIPLTESLRVEDATAGGVTYHVYKFVAADCVAKQVTDDAVITFLYDGNPVADSTGTALRSYTISVRSYCEDNLDPDNSTASAKLKALCRAVLSYGAAAQTRFSYKTDDLANATYRVDDPSTSIPASYQKQAATGSCSAVQGAAISLVLESRTQINFYIMPASGYTADDIMDLITVKLGDAVVTNYTKTKVTSGNMNGAVLVSVTGIAAKNLDDVYAVSVGNDTYGTRTWYQSPLNYAYDAQSNATEGALVLALYDYFLAAQAYMSNN